jgi:hypothetical protein
MAGSERALCGHSKRFRLAAAPLANANPDFF